MRGDPENPTLASDIDDLELADARELDDRVGANGAHVRLYHYRGGRLAVRRAYCDDCTAADARLFVGMSYSLANFSDWPCEICGRHEGERG